MLGALEDRRRAAGDPGGPRHDVTDIEAGEAVFEREIARHREAHGELAARHHRGHVAAARREQARVRGQAPQPFPALRLAVALQDHLVGGVAARGAVGRRLHDVALEPRIEQVVPVSRRRHAEPFEKPRVIRDARGFEHRADPHPLRIFQRHGLSLAERGGNGIEDGSRQIERREQALGRKAVVERALAAPEQIGLRPAVPLDDAPVGDRRAGRERAGPDLDIPALLREPGELGERRVRQALSDRRDDHQLVLDRLRPRDRGAEQRPEDSDNEGKRFHPSIRSQTVRKRGHATIPA